MQVVTCAAEVRKTASVKFTFLHKEIAALPSFACRHTLETSGKWDSTGVSKESRETGEPRRHEPSHWD